jgi:hypothetical protein
MLGGYSKNKNQKKESFKQVHDLINVGIHKHTHKVLKDYASCESNSRAKEILTATWFRVI